MQRVRSLNTNPSRARDERGRGGDVWEEERGGARRGVKFKYEE